MLIKSSALFFEPVVLYSLISVSSLTSFACCMVPTHQEIRRKSVPFSGEGKIWEFCESARNEGKIREFG